MFTPLASASSGSVLLAERTRFAPCEKNHLAQAAPIPEEAPMSQIFLFLKSEILNILEDLKPKENKKTVDPRWEKLKEIITNK